MTSTTPVSSRSVASPNPAVAPAAPRVAALDGLRGIAVLLVVCVHSGLLELGMVGVDVFFAVSGYLIATILLHEHERTGAIDRGAFYARRFRRLLPALWLGVVGTIAMAARGHFALGPTLGGALLSVTYTTDLLWWIWPDSRMQHTWSLAIEEQFYLLFPIVLVGLLRRRAARSLVRPTLVLAAGLVTARAALYLAVGGTDRADFALYATRFEPILFGVALAFALQPGVPRTNALQWLTSARASALAVAALVAFQASAIGMPSLHFPGRLYLGGFALTAMATTVVVARLVTTDATPLHRVLGHRSLASIGRISYGIYLFHYPMLFVLHRHVHDRVALTVALIAVGIALAALSEVVLERRVRRPSGTAVTAPRSPDSRRVRPARARA